MPRSSRRARAAVLAVALGGALGLSACSDDASVSAPASTAAQTSAAAPSSSAETPAATSAAPTSESAAPVEESTTTSTTAASPTTSASKGDMKVTPSGTTLKVGQPALIETRDGELFRVTPKTLAAAPDSDYAAANLDKADGTMYYLTFDVSNVGDVEGHVNRRYLHPKTDAGGMMGPKVLYGSTPACKGTAGDLAPGATQTNCYIYQIDGAPITDVEYAGSPQKLTWTK
ncbi:hypothetical protein [Luteipulveratus halotolerans]|uniref:DUF4352 domain-containing protein n=1 Tax=Luteipulveratus halotolerans TaxID=1631356 RepID=A0A0L6CEA1_9MICO|nr:hypothetical protein [Luteipulveratus halotolerans]KNX36132.1 hypothetical protein VV01_01565 [Luteipulveratus halotolerans]